MTIRQVRCGGIEGHRLNSEVVVQERRRSVSRNSCKRKKKKEQRQTHRKADRGKKKEETEEAGGGRGTLCPPKYNNNNKNCKTARSPRLHMHRMSGVGNSQHLPGNNNPATRRLTDTSLLCSSHTDDTGECASVYRF